MVRFKQRKIKDEFSGHNIYGNHVYNADRVETIYVHPECGHEQRTQSSFIPFRCTAPNCDLVLPNVIKLLGKNNITTRVEYFVTKMLPK